VIFAVIDVGTLRPIKDQLTATVDKDGVITYGKIKLAIAVLAVKTGFLRSHKAVTCNTISPQSQAGPSQPLVSERWKIYIYTCIYCTINSMS